MSGGWTDENIDRLRKLWADGYSASQAAEALGPWCSRSAVIGKVHRLGIAERHKGHQTPRKKPRERIRDAQAKKTNPLNSPTATAPVLHPIAPYVEPTPAPLPQSSEPVTILDLRESMCRWPIGDPLTSDFRFCGARKPIDGKPYCDHHAQLAYSTSPKPSKAHSEEANLRRRMAMLKLGNHGFAKKEAKRK